MFCVRGALSTSISSVFVLCCLAEDMQEEDSFCQYDKFGFPPSDYQSR